ncbi:MAG TPA: hypothetical protein VGD23_13390 [Sphingomicrobium sp.]
MASSAIKLTKAEWRQVAGIAQQIDWTRHDAGRIAAPTAGISDRAATALQQLFRLV